MRSLCLVGLCYLDAQPVLGGGREAVSLCLVGLCYLDVQPVLGGAVLP